jgi:hypothetical protein
LIIGKQMSKKKVSGGFRLRVVDYSREVCLSKKVVFFSIVGIQVKQERFLGRNQVGKVSEVNTVKSSTSRTS